MGLARPPHSPPTHWDAYAANWRLIGAPLRPSAPDLEYLTASVARFAAGASSALLLGVTPEIAALTWPSPLQLVAADRSEGMVRGVWPGDTKTRRALVADWLTLDVPEAPFDVAIGDGVFTLLDYPSGYARLAKSLARLVKPGGLLALRLFCRPTPHERPEAVFREAFAGGIRNFNVFKWRLAMALQGDATGGVRLADIWTTFCESGGSVANVAERTGWQGAIVGTIEAYRGVDERYTFPTSSEVLGCLADAFELLELVHPTYELGERCPQLSLRRR